MTSLKLGSHSDALTRVARLIKILHLIRSRPSDKSLGRKELADACDCDVRTIQRDLDLLQWQAQVPLEYDRPQKAYRLSDPAWTFPLGQFALEDHLALLLARGLLKAPTFPGSASLSRTLEKLSALLPTDLRQLLSDAEAILVSARLPRSYAAAPLSSLIEGATLHRTLSIDYESRSRRGRLWRNVDPYALEAREGIYWELHGWCHQNEAIRTFAVDRIHGVEMLSESFDRREAEWSAFSDTAGIFGGVRGDAWVEVDVRFDPTVAPWARDRQWPPSLALHPQSDGSTLLVGKIEGLESFLTELLRWRRHAVVRGGPELRRRMEEEVQALSSLYRKEIPENSESPFTE